MKTLALSLLGLLLAAPAAASDPAQLKKNAQESLEKASKALEAGDLSTALTEGDWALQYIRQLDSAQGVSQFPKEVLGLKLGEVETQEMMGVTSIQTVYSDGSDEVRFSLTQLGGGNNPLNAFANMGLAAQPNKFRAGPFTGSQPKPNEANLQTPKGMAVFKSSQRTGPDLQKFVLAFVEATKDYLSGQ